MQEIAASVALETVTSEPEPVGEVKSERERGEEEEERETHLQTAFPTSCENLQSLLRQFPAR